MAISLISILKTTFNKVLYPIDEKNDSTNISSNSSSTNTKAKNWLNIKFNKNLTKV